MTKAELGRKNNGSLSSRYVDVLVNAAYSEDPLLPLLSMLPLLPLLSMLPLSLEPLELVSLEFLGVFMFLVWVVPFLLLWCWLVADWVVVASSPGWAEVLLPRLVPPAIAIGTFIATKSAATGIALHKVMIRIAFLLESGSNKGVPNIASCIHHLYQKTH